MRDATRSVRFGVRLYREGDESAVLELLRRALGPGPTRERSAELFRWKHISNPFGPSLMLVAEADRRIVGLRAFMRWRFDVPGHSLVAVRAVDTATDPAFQRMGLFRTLTLRALDELREDVAFVFNTPNEKSLAGYLKMGWRPVGKVRIKVRLRRPIRFARGARTLRSPVSGQPSSPQINAKRAEDALRDDEGVSRLLQENVGSEWRLRTRRDIRYLRWRYGAAPTLDYRAVRLEDGDGLRGLALFRVRPRGRLWESMVTEVIVRPGDRRAARSLLTRVARACPVDHLICHFPPRSTPARGAISAGFMPAPGGVVLVVNMLAENIHPDPTSLDSWALSLGELEVF